MGTGRRAGYVGENCKFGEQPSCTLQTSSIYCIVSVYSRNSPPFVYPFLTNPKPLPLSSSVIYCPPINVLLGNLGLVGECIKLLYLPQFDGPCLDAIVNISRLLLVGKAKANKGEVATS